MKSCAFCPPKIVISNSSFVCQCLVPQSYSNCCIYVNRVAHAISYFKMIRHWASLRDGCVSFAAFDLERSWQFNSPENPTEDHALSWLGRHDVRGDFAPIALRAPLFCCLELKIRKARIVERAKALEMREQELAILEADVRVKYRYVAHDKVPSRMANSSFENYQKCWGKIINATRY